MKHLTRESYTRRCVIRQNLNQITIRVILMSPSLIPSIRKVLRLLYVNSKAHIAVTDLLSIYTIGRQRHTHDLVPKLRQQAIYISGYISPRYISTRVTHSCYTLIESYYRRRNFSLSRNCQVFLALVSTKTR